MLNETLKNAKILIVDDQQQNIDVLTGLLDFTGYNNYTTTTDSRKVLDLFNTYKPNLIMLDLMMPHFNGFQIMDQLKQHIKPGSFLPILVLTADIKTETKQQALANGATDFLTKPFDLIEVELRVRNLLKTLQLHQRLENQNMILEEKVKERTETLQRSEAQFKVLFTKAPIGIALINSKTGKIKKLNLVFANIMGRTQEDLFQIDWMNITNLNNFEPHTNKMFLLNSGKINSFQFEKSFLYKDGTLVWVSFTIAALKLTGESTPYNIFMIEDITEKRKLERDFIHAFIDAQELEKHNFGEELHDGISQILSAQCMYIDGMMKQFKDQLNDKAKFLLKIKELNTSAINDTRAIAHGLMSKQLEENGLILAVKHICNDYNQSKKVKFNCICSGLLEEEISKEIKIQLFRIAQEISTNIIRHSGATKAEVSLTKKGENQLELVVKDDGVGIDLIKIKKENKGAGLKNIERRITLINGKLNLDTTPDEGTKYTILIPLN